MSLADARHFSTCSKIQVTIFQRILLTRYEEYFYIGKLIYRIGKWYQSNVVYYNIVTNKNYIRWYVWNWSTSDSTVSKICN